MKTSKVIISGLTLLAAYSAHASETMFTPENVTAGINLGSLSGETKERVYSPDNNGWKVSQLNWEYSNAAIIKGTLDWDPLPWVSVGAEGWTTLADKGGEMNDYDWLNLSQSHWTDHSNHPDTTLNYANEFDINIKGWIVNRPDWRAGVMAGYQESRYSFTASGGSYNYSNGHEQGNFEAGKPVIGYAQRYRMPYIGLVGVFRYEQFELEGSFKYSDWVHSTDYDQHYLRTMESQTEIHKQNTYILSGSLGYYVTKNAKVFFEASWTRTTNDKGQLLTVDVPKQQYSDNKDGGGIENYSVMTSAGLKYYF